VGGADGIPPADSFQQDGPGFFFHVLSGREKTPDAQSSSPSSSFSSSSFVIAV